MTASHGTPSKRNSDQEQDVDFPSSPPAYEEPAKKKKRGFLSRMVFNRFTAIGALGAAVGFAGGKYDIDHPPREWASDTFNKIGNFLSTSGEASDKKLKEASDFVAPKEP